VEDFKRNPTGSLVTIHCRPWHYGGKAVLIGDAAHAIVPFYGQGMNCAFEDCSALAVLMREARSRKRPWDEVFADFERRRRPHADAIADMALDNFIEMRDKTASPVFRMKKKVEHTLHHLFPKWFTPLYNMISFTTIPYAEARRKAKTQATTLALILGTMAAVILLGVALLVFT
jgi:kynurenine 3-monooxygenase